MKRNYLNEIFDCFIFAVINGLGNCIGHWVGTYFIEKYHKKGQRRIGF